MLQALRNLTEMGCKITLDNHSFGVMEEQLNLRVEVQYKDAHMQHLFSHSELVSARCDIVTPWLECVHEEISEAISNGRI